MAGVSSLQGFNVRLVAGLANSGSLWDAGTVLDLYKDEDILIDNNSTQIMDLGAVPATFVRELLLPGTKKNNEFFNSVTNWDLVNPQQWQSSNKVRAYLDVNGVYFVDGYIQVNRVNIYQNKFVDSYSVTIFGIISNINADLQRKFLTDTEGLSIYNHTASWSNVTKSWAGDLFNGDVVYSLADSGQKYYYSSQRNVGLDEPEGAINIRDLKPAIRLRKVWDAILADSGYTSTGSFWMQEWLNDVYVIANNKKDSLIVRKNGELIDLHKYGTYKITNQFSGSALTSNTSYELSALNFKGVEYNNNLKYDPTTGIYHIDVDSPLLGNIVLDFSINGESAPSVVPTYPNSINILARRASDNSIMQTIELDKISSEYRSAIQSPFSSSYLSSKANNVTNSFNQSFELEQQFATNILTSGSYKFNLIFTQGGLGTDYPVFIDRGSAAPSSSFSIDRVKYAADSNIVDMPANMPQGGEGGIKQIDFIVGIQKKFNLRIYQDKNVPNQIICETFNDWYKQGNLYDFNNFINEQEPIVIEPLNAYTIAKVEFSDKKDSDYVSTVFDREYNRTFGAAYYYDTSSYFSQGEFKIDTCFSSAPLVAVPNMASTSDVGVCTSYDFVNRNTDTIVCTFSYSDCSTGVTTLVNVPPNTTINVCSRNLPLKMSYNTSLWGDIVEKTYNCSTYTTTAPEPNVLFIPYYIASEKYESATVLPRVMFYNGLKKVENWHYNGADTGYSNNRNTYPYFDNYQVEDTVIGPVTSSRSLLFLNEEPIFGTTPTASLIDTYWSTYLQLMYKSDAKLLKCSAIIPIAAYGTIELNDIVNYRSNLYHIHSINSYNLSTNECQLTLLGPIIPDTLSSILSPGQTGNVVNKVWDTTNEIWNLTEVYWSF